MTGENIRVARETRRKPRSGFLFSSPASASARPPGRDEAKSESPSSKLVQAAECMPFFSTEARKRKGDKDREARGKAY